MASLTSSCRDLFGEDSRWITPAGYPRSFALCVIDSIFSTGSHYQSVINVLNAYRASRRAQGGDPATDGPVELLQSVTDAGGVLGWAQDVVHSRKPAHTSPGAPLKAQVAYEAAVMLDQLGYSTPAKVPEAFQKGTTAPLEAAWRRLPSQSSGITYSYFLMLAGLQSVKPDRMVTRFIATHTGLDPRQPSPTVVASLVKDVAAAYPTQARMLEHLVWRYTSGRGIVLPEVIPVAPVL